MYYSNAVLCFIANFKLTNMAAKILIVEDEVIVANDIRRTLERSEIPVMGIARSVAAALKMMHAERPFLVLLDIYLEGDLTGIDLADRLNAMGIPFIYLSANSNQPILEKVKISNPYGFIVKPFRAKDLLVSLDIARYRIARQREAAVLPPRTADAPGLNKKKVYPGSPALPADVINFEGIVGNSIAMKKAFRLIQQVAPLDTSVLITGESGTGKEGVASAIHRLSPRRTGPFIKINCAALPSQLIESELFGHEKGSFTGAFEKKIGKFEQASGGTILLDEIGEIPLDMQVKLLRVLQEREVDRIGGAAPVKVDVRVIASTNKNIERELASGRFRLDLYYRLLVFPIEMPALRDRHGDLPMLVSHFIHLYGIRNLKTVKKVPDSTMKLLERHSWPGNVRELEFLIERALLLGDGEMLDEQSIRSHADQASVAETRSPVTMQEIENIHIMSVLQKCNNKIAGSGGAAEVLGMPPSTLYSRMKKLGIVRSFQS